MPKFGIAWDGTLVVGHVFIFTHNPILSRCPDFSHGSLYAEICRRISCGFQYPRHHNSVVISPEHSIPANRHWMNPSLVWIGPHSLSRTVHIVMSPHDDPSPPSSTRACSALNFAIFKQVHGGQAKFFLCGTPRSRACLTAVPCAMHQTRIRERQNAR